MAYYRQYQATAELGGLSDLVAYGSPGVPNLPSIDGTTKYTGAGSYQFTANEDMIGKYGTAYQAFRCGAWVYIDDLPGTSDAGVVFLISTARGYNGAFIVYVTDTGLLALSHNSTEGGVYDWTESVDAAGAGLELDGWHHVGLTGKRDSSGWDMRLFVDGALALSVDDKGAHSSTVDNLFFGGGYPYNWTGGWIEAYFDDVYFDGATTGESIDTPPPAYRFLIARPSGDGTTNDWTASAGGNSTCVDDAPPNGDTDYVEADGEEMRETYGVPTVTLPQGYGITAVIPFAVVRKGDTALDAKIAMVMTESGAEHVTAAPFEVTISYHEYFERLATRPGGASWTAATLDACEMGFESAGTFV